MTTMTDEPKIFVVGLSRTGTLSLTRALKLLGIKAQHYPNDPVTQRELKSGNYRLSILREYRALTDIPVAPFYAQFDELFPGSKFILTTRPTEEWLVSVENHYRNYVEHHRDQFDDFISACVYGTLHFSRQRFAYVKELHEAACRSYFAGRPEQFMVLELGSGWDTLCPFLGCAVPAASFPHANQGLSGPATAPPREGILRRMLGRARRRLG